MHEYVTRQDKHPCDLGLTFETCASNKRHHIFASKMSKSRAGDLERRIAALERENKHLKEKLCELEEFETIGMQF